MHPTAIRNLWEFAAPPVESAMLKAVGSAVRTNHVLRFDYLTADGCRRHPFDPDFRPPLRVEPHHLVIWGAGTSLRTSRPIRDGASSGSTASTLATPRASRSREEGCRAPASRASS